MAVESVHPEIKLEDTTPVQFSMQPFASIITQEYEPEDKLVMSSEEDEKPFGPIQKYEYGEVAPLTVISIEPSLFNEEASTILATTIKGFGS